MRCAKISLNFFWRKRGAFDESNTGKKRFCQQHRDNEAKDFCSKNGLLSWPTEQTNQDKSLSLFLLSFYLCLSIPSREASCKPLSLSLSSLIFTLSLLEQAYNSSARANRVVPNDVGQVVIYEILCIVWENMLIYKPKKILK